MNDCNISVSTLKLHSEFSFDENILFTYQIEYPHFTSETPLPSLITVNQFYLQKAQRFEGYLNQTFRQNTSGFLNHLRPGYQTKYEAVMEYTITFHQGCIISLYTTQYLFAGGAHGSTIQSSETWNMQTGKQLSLKSFYPEHIDYITRIENQIISQITAQIEAGTNFYFDNYKVLVQQMLRPENFYLTPESIIVYFQEYDIAPYAAGIPEFKLPYENKPV